MEKCFIDSNIIIENYKGNLHARTSLEKLSKDCLVYINPIVVSEVTYILKKKLNYGILQIAEKLSSFIMLSIGIEIINLSYKYMHEYNIKPNDAIIAGTCIFHKISNILTLDDDFIKVCKNENLNLLS